MQRLLKPRSTSKVRFSLHCSFGGWNKYYGVGNIPNVVAKGMSGGISSMDIPSDLKVIAYRGNNYTGSTKTFTGRINCLVSYGWNDLINSLKIVEK